MGDRRGHLKGGLRGLLVALAFLTVVPIRLRPQPSADDVARSRFWYPLVGLLLGGVLAGWGALTTRLNAPPLAAFLVLAAWVGLTGALHVDGWCDLCDGLFGGHTPEDRLCILKDPHLGSFGLAGGVLLLLGKFVLLQQVLPSARGPLIVGAAVLTSRCLVLVMAAGATYPRAEGTGKALVESVRGWEGGLAAAVGLFAALAAVGSVPEGLGAFVAALAVVGLLRGLCRNRLGGITGDCLGAAIELAESVFLLTAVVWAAVTSG